MYSQRIHLLLHKKVLIKRDMKVHQQSCTKTTANCQGYPPHYVVSVRQVFEESQYTLMPSPSS